MIQRPDMQQPDGPAIYQLTDGDEPWCHVYMEAPVSTPDSAALVIHRSASPHGGRKDDPRHQYFLCRHRDGGELVQLTEETGVTGPALDPTGAWCYYFVNETELNGGRFSLKRVGIDGTRRETILTVDHPLSGARYKASRLYPLSTISSDGRKIATAVFLGDGREETIDWGLLVCDVEAASADLVLQGPTYANLHPQFCRDKNRPRELMIQENHGNEIEADGRIIKTANALGADVHLILDDGSNMRSFPWGRDGTERIQGHQCWRGVQFTAVASVSGNGRHLIEAPPAPFADHAGATNPQGARNVLTRLDESPQYIHFGTDEAGEMLATDYDGGKTYLLYTARFGANADDPLQDWRFICDTGSRVDKDAHVHPFLSPDGARAFFNSDESGRCQAYMAILE